MPDTDYVAAQDVLSDVRLSFHRDAKTSRGRTGAKGSASPADVDLHNFSNWGEAAGEDFFTEVQTIHLDGVDVHVPRVEVHLRALCLHFMRHAAVRPLRLCDIALLLETQGETFDWDRCLRGSRRQSEQIIVTLRLAHQLLGARLDDAPPAVRERTLPAWLVPAVIRQWRENPTVPRPVLTEILDNPRGIIRTFTRP